MDKKIYKSRCITVTEHISTSSMLYPKCTDMIQTQIPKCFHVESIRISTPRNRNHGSETTVNCWQHYIRINTEVAMSQSASYLKSSIFVPGRGKGNRFESLYWYTYHKGQWEPLDLILMKISGTHKVINRVSNCVSSNYVLSIILQFVPSPCVSLHCTTIVVCLVCPVL